ARVGAGRAFSDGVSHRAPVKPPRVRLAGGAQKAAAERGITAWHLSISHTSEIAMASAIAISGTVHGEGSERD
ncbi:MAG: hypothetical protein OXG11_02985, partial [Chloroflexi bacterium]|nr:hypothetical protein [Chloroflexota bacterium]